MKTKLFLAAVAVAFSFAVTSCGNKPANASSESVEIETVEAAAPCCMTDSAACDSAKACCAKEAGCEKQATCEKKAACEKKACDKK